MGAADKGRQTHTPALNDHLRRWSERKLASAGTAPGQPRPTANTPAPDGGPAQSSPEGLGQTVDVSAYLSPEVDDSLHRLVLRRLFREPLYHYRDGLNEYDEDYSFFSSRGDDLLTHEMKRALSEAVAPVASVSPTAGEQAAGVKPAGDADEETPPA